MERKERQAEDLLKEIESWADQAAKSAARASDAADNADSSRVRAESALEEITRSMSPSGPTCVTQRVAEEEVFELLGFQFWIDRISKEGLVQNLKMGSEILLAEGGGNGHSFLISFQKSDQTYILAASDFEDNPGDSPDTSLLTLCKIGISR